MNSGFIQEVGRFMRVGHLLGREVSLLIGPDTIFIRMGSILANRAGCYFIRMRSDLGKCP